MKRRVPGLDTPDHAKIAPRWTLAIIAAKSGMLKWPDVLWKCLSARKISSLKNTKFPPAPETPSFKIEEIKWYLTSCAGNWFADHNE